MISVENRVFQISRSTFKFFRNSASWAAVATSYRFESLICSFGQYSKYIVYIFARCSFVDTDTYTFFANVAEVDFVFQSYFADNVCFNRTLNSQCIEEEFIVLFVSIFFYFFSYNASNIVDVSSNSSNTFLTMPCSIETSHDRYQSLRSTDV